VYAGSWRPAEPITGFTSLAIADSPAGWDTVVPLAELTPGTKYSFRATSEDEEHATASVDFTLEDLSDLKRGHVTYLWQVLQEGDDMLVDASLEKFKKAACYI
jgi:hypothetical protein